MLYFKTFKTTLLQLFSDDFAIVLDSLILQENHNIPTLSVNIN